MIDFDTFISYSSHDKAVADATCAALEAAGIRCWIAPRDILPGTDWGASILDALERCRVMVLIFSANANTSPQIRREVERAVDRGISVVPFRIEDITPTKAMAYFMGPVHWLDALTPPLEGHLVSLAESIKALIAMAAPQPDAQTDPAPVPRPAAALPPAPPPVAAVAPAPAAPAAEAPRLLKYAAIVSIGISLFLAFLALLIKDLPDFVAVTALAAVGYWLIYRNLAADRTTAKIAALGSAAVWVYFILLNSVAQNLLLMLIEAVNAGALVCVFAKLPWASRRP